ncbi:MAG: RNA polymerase sigma factor [Chloroflexota bacterium]
MADDDAALVAAARANAAGFAQLYERYVGRIYRYCYVRLGSRERAEDATSEVFLNALRARASFRSSVFAAWLFQIAHNVVLNTPRRPLHSLDLAADLPDAGPSPDLLAETRLQREAVRAALDTLPDQQRSIVELQLAGWADDEIGQALGKRVGAVRMLRYRALDRLRQVLAGQDGEGTA